MSLPHLPYRLIGREEQLLHLDQLLLEHRFVTLTGPGGVGKTTLAIEAAHTAGDRCEHGVIFVPLASVRDPSLVIPAIARALGVPEPGTIWSAEALAPHLSEQSLLLLLDNLEQVQSCATDLSTLMALCPQLTLLVTSRTRLNVRGEQVFIIPPLPIPELGSGGAVGQLLSSPAVSLFIERARATDPLLQLDDPDLEAAAEICRRLDGLPLAIELAASRVALLSPRHILERMDHRLPLLTGGPQDAPERQQTLRSTAAWSYDLLSGTAQWLFRQLAVFVGGFSLESAEHMIGSVSPVDDAVASDESVLRTLGALVDSNLILRTPGSEDARFSWLETMREFAWEQLNEQGELAEARHHHAELMAAMVERLRPSIEGPDAAVVLSRFDDEHANLRAALTYACESNNGALGIRLVASLWKFWVVRGHGPEGKRWIESILALEGSDIPAYRLEALYAGASFALDGDETDLARTWLNEGLALAQEHQDAHLESRMLFMLGLWARKTGDPKAASEYFERALPLSRSMSNVIGFAEHMTAMILLNISAINVELADMERAQAAAQEAYAIWQRRGDPWGLAISGEALGIVANTCGNPAQAASLLRQSLTLFRDLGDHGGMVNCLTSLAMVAANTGRFTVAARLFAASEKSRELVGNQIPAPIQHSYPEAVARARSSLGARRFDLSWQSGLELSLEDAFAMVTGLSFDDPAPKSEERLLTQRELEVLRMIANGHTDQEIADALFIRYRTATSHVGNILNKLGVDSRTAASADAIRLGLI